MAVKKRRIGNMAEKKRRKKGRRESKRWKRREVGGRTEYG